MEKRRIVLPDIERFYARSLHSDIPEYQTIRIAHAVVTKGGYTLRMSGYPAIGPEGIIGKGDMRVQTLQALEYVKRTVEAGVNPAAMARHASMPRSSQEFHMSKTCRSSEYSETKASTSFS